MSSSSSSLITTEDGGRQNMFAREPRLQLEKNYNSYSSEAEKTNGRWAMIGIFAALGTYIFTGQIIPGIF